MLCLFFCLYFLIWTKILYFLQILKKNKKYEDYVPPKPEISGMSKNKFRKFRRQMERRLSNTKQSIVKLERRGVLPANYLTDWELAMENRTSERDETRESVARLITQRPSLTNLVNKGIVREQFVDLDANQAYEILEKQNKEIKHLLERKLTTPVAITEEEKSRSINDAFPFDVSKNTTLSAYTFLVFLQL